MTKINWEKYKKVIKKEFSEKEETEEVKNYIFSSQLDKVNLILEHMDTVGGIHSRNIAITGDRGTGKTSFIETLKLVLEKQNYYVFDIVSPTVLSSHLNILEIDNM
ncbi:ATP-binding protein [Streptococcus suis]|uniref:ATP-binding protein n=1 Tax=Streptococcus suis TaxID=1307 RepID=UPI001582F647|nr:ATP-binding protein [Streptococcus suis]